MIYRCQRITLDRLPVMPMGMADPLCNSCMSKDCDNPIEPVQISIMGVTKTMKVYSQNGKPAFVLECEGYINKSGSRLAPPMTQE